MGWNLGFFVAYIATAAADIQVPSDKSLANGETVPTRPTFRDNAAHKQSLGRTAAARPTS